MRYAASEGHRNVESLERVIGTIAIGYVIGDNQAWAARGRQVHKMIASQQKIKSCTIILASCIMLAIISNISPVSAQNKLPNLIKTNSFIAGQVFGCVVRFEVYARLSEARRSGSDKTKLTGAVRANLNLNFEKLRSDLEEIVQWSTEVKKAIQTIAEKEYGEEEIDQGFAEGWMQMIGCGRLFHDLDIFVKYPEK